MKRLWKKATGCSATLGKAIYWLVIRVSIGVLFLAVLFGIMQPFIWMWKWGESPPAGAISLSILLTTILALVALFAGLAYWNLRHFLEESLGREVRLEMKAGLARTVGMTAYATWRAWQSDHKNRELLEAACKMQRHVLEELVEKMTGEELRKVAEILPENRIHQQKSNFASYIACKGHWFPSYVDQSEETLARKFGKETYEKACELGDNYDWHANYAGLLAVFGTAEEKQKAEQIMAAIKRRVTQEEWKEYHALFEPPKNPCYILDEKDTK